jgi:hypothetical protein
MRNCLRERAAVDLEDLRKSMAPFVFISFYSRFMLIGLIGTAYLMNFSSAESLILDWKKLGASQKVLSI